VPAPAVIPALIAYIKIVAVKTFGADFRLPEAVGKGTRGVARSELGGIRGPAHGATAVSRV